jgi:MFS family permease
VEHPCQRCGSAVDDSAPFCNSCGAPQVRFAGIDIAPHSFKVQAPAASLSTQIESETVPSPTSGLDKKSALRVALTAGAIAALVSLLPLGIVFGSPVGGFLSVLLYRRRSWIGDPSPRMGFRLGALCGMFGYAIFLVLAAAQIALSHAQNEVRDAMIETIHRQQARNPDPQARQMLDHFLTPHGLLVMMIAGLVLMGIVFVLVSGVGGAISAALLRRKGPSS